MRKRGLHFHIGNEALNEKTKLLSVFSKNPKNMGTIRRKLFMSKTPHMNFCFTSGKNQIVMEFEE
jgi:hypothetical protein